MRRFIRYQSVVDDEPQLRFEFGYEPDRLTSDEITALQETIARDDSRDERGWYRRLRSKLPEFENHHEYLRFLSRDTDPRGPKFVNAKRVGIGLGAISVHRRG